MSTSQVPERDNIIAQRDWPYLIVLLGIGVITRAIFFSQIYLISPDGAFQYIPVAELFAWGEYREALLQVQLPLYPWLVALVTELTGNFEVSGQIISLTASILAVIPLFLLGRHMFGEATAFWAGIFYFLNPEMLQRSVDVLKEGLLIFLLFWAVLLFYMFLTRRGISWLMAAMFVTVMAALTRVASFVLIPVFIFWVLFYKRKPFDVSYYKRLGYLGTIAVFCAAVLLPLMMNVKAVTGEWDISKKTVTVHSLIESVLFGKTDETAEEERGPFKLAKKIIKVYHPILFLFLVAGLGRRKAVPRDYVKEIFLFSFIFSHLSIIGMMMWSTQRYLFFPILLSYLWAGVGAVDLQHRIMSKTRLSPPTVTVGFLLLVFIVFLPVLSQPQRVEKLGRKAIGFWIMNQETGKPSILTDLPRVVYYAHGHLVMMNRWNYKQNISEARARGIQYIVVRQKSIKRTYPDLLELAAKDFSIQKVPQLTEKDSKEYFVLKVLNFSDGWTKGAFF